jgi:hypothetical protein
MASTKPGGDKPRGNGRDKAEDFQEDPPRASDTNGAGNNSEARTKAMDEAIEQFCTLQTEEDALIELHIKPIREKKAELKSDLKKNHEVPTAAFNARAALRLIEKFGDDEVVLATNELFRATPVGSNLDLVAIAERVVQKKAEKAAAKAKKETQATSTEQTL